MAMAAESRVATLVEAVPAADPPRSVSAHSR
jgi:hypothetical protein